MTTKTPREPGRKRAAPPDAAKVFPHVIRFRITHPPEGVEDYRASAREHLFIKLIQIGFGAQRPNLVKNGLPRALEDWWYVVPQEVDERKILLSVLKRAKAQRVIAEIQTIPYDKLHPAPVDQESLSRRIQEMKRGRVN